MCDITAWQIIIISIIGIIAIVGFFMTKTSGFGKFTTSTCLLILTMVIAAILSLDNKIDNNMANLLFAIIGFAGGLFTSKENSNKETDKSKNNKSSNKAETGKSES